MIRESEETRLWREWRQSLLRFVRARVGDDGTAEDLVHDVLLRAHAARGDLRDDERLGAWLHRIARNVVIDHYRARRPLDPLPEDLAEEHEPADPRRRLAQCLLTAIDRLPDGQREAVRLSEIEGMTQQETAERLGLSLSGAKSRVQRGRARLSELLHLCCRIETDGRGGIVDFEHRADSPYPPCPGCDPNEP